MGAIILAAPGSRRNARHLGRSLVTAGAALVALFLVPHHAHAAGSADKECAAASRAAADLRSAGDLTGARGHLAACASSDCSRALRDECARQLAAVEAVTPAVTLEAKDETSNSVREVGVFLDGARVLERLDGSPLPVNPGEHRLAFEAAGFRRAESAFVAREGQKKLRVVVYLDRAGSSAAPPLVSDAAGPATARAGSSMFGTPRKKVALALVGVGVAGAAVGTVFALSAKSTYDHALGTECGGDANRCSQQGIDDGKTAHRRATIATVGFVAAGALLAAGAALFFTGTEERDLALTVDPGVDGAKGLALVGKW